MNPKTIDLSPELEKHFSEIIGKKINKVDLIELTTEEISNLFPDRGDTPILLISDVGSHNDW